MLHKRLKIRALVGGRYDNPDPTRFLAPIVCPKITALGSLKGLQILALDIVLIAEMVTINASWEALYRQSQVTAHNGQCKWGMSRLPTDS